MDHSIPRVCVQWTSAIGIIGWNVASGVVIQRTPHVPVVPVRIDTNASIRIWSSVFAPPSIIVTRMFMAIGLTIGTTHISPLDNQGWIDGTYEVVQLVNDSGRKRRGNNSSIWCAQASAALSQEKTRIRRYSASCSLGSGQGSATERPGLLVLLRPGGVSSRRLFAENLRFYAAIGSQRRVVPALRSPAIGAQFVSRWLVTSGGTTGGTRSAIFRKNQ